MRNTLARGATPTTSARGGRLPGVAGVLGERARPGSPGPNPDGTTITLWWRSADAQATYEYLRAVGVPIGREPFDGPFGRQFTLTDPDGYKITIYEKDQQMFWPPRS